MNLYFARHGHTPWNEEKIIQGSKDIELSSKGIKQAHELAESLSKVEFNISRIYTSPLKRAELTAKISAIEVDIPFQIMTGLEEINLGDWEGRTWKDVKKNYPKEFDTWLHNRRLEKSPNGESYQDLIERVLPAIENIIKDNNSEENILVVTHSAVIMCLQCLINQVSFEEMDKYKLGNTEVIRLNTEDIEKAVSLLNVE
ncbi:hypothetical protein BG261_02635 [Floricoccus tropicus]|uniref:Phosphoglycerate mutase n=1 Tax=Floricoccus tropicus TaxID=1859473 RepID=A0A1E8GMM5_9LACT|nr:histidine phosphatase family protein [Floricoccus tropicus]OFI49494.1 hypothetical protein BG261_02635 [Floricoccus tropicus]